MERPAVDPEGNVRDLMNVGDDVVALHIDVDAVEILVVHNRFMLCPSRRHVGVTIHDGTVACCRCRVTSHLQQGGGDTSADLQL